MTEAHDIYMPENNRKWTNRTQRAFVVMGSTIPSRNLMEAPQILDWYKANNSKRLVTGQASPKSPAVTCAFPHQASESFSLRGELGHCCLLPPFQKEGASFFAHVSTQIIRGQAANIL